MRFERVQEPSHRTGYGRLITLFFLHGMALSMWFVPLSTVLEANGLGSIRSYAYAVAGVAAFISPLVFGAMADRHVPPVRVLRGLALATSAAMTLATWSIDRGLPAGWVLLAIQVHALCSAPTWSISTAIVLGGLRNPTREFGPIRAVATFGWMTGCWTVSLLQADTSPLAGYGGAIVWLAVAAFSFALPAVEPPMSAASLSLSQRLGLDALTLMNHRDHRAVFITAALFAIPLAAFYPFTPPHLRALGLERTTAWMSLGQVTEIIAMLMLATLLTQWRLKWIFACGLGFGVLRYLLCALDGKLAVLAGVSIHGFAFTLFFITAPIYLNERVDPAWRSRAQALLTVMTSGLGNLIGYLGSGWWYVFTDGPGAWRWTGFWGGLTVVSAAVFAYFLITYRGKKHAGLGPEPG